MQISLTDINILQENIVRFVNEWAHSHTKPIPQKRIMVAMTRKGVKTCTTINAINVLLRRGYLRRAVCISNKTYYVLCRTV
jgi:hypothetical protein